MKQPNTPSVSPSEPEIEQRVAKEALNKISNDGFDGIKIHLPYVKKYLNEHNLDTDCKGFIIDKETHEYSTAYVFVEELVSEYVKDDDESIFDAFFRPVTDKRVHGWDETRVHITDLHSIITTNDGNSHPIKDDSFNIAKLHARLETGFKVVMSWSDIVQKENIDENGLWLGLAKDPINPNESKDELEINCMNPECGYVGNVSKWNGNTHTNPECPDCGSAWNSEGISVCTICENWYWGMNFEGESPYSVPTCVNCGEDIEYIERVLRYDEVDDLIELIKGNKPKYNIVGLDSDNNVIYTFDRCESKEEAIEQKDISKTICKNVADSSKFSEVETIAIRENSNEINPTKYTE